MCIRDRYTANNNGIDFSIPDVPHDINDLDDVTFTEPTGTASVEGIMWDATAGTDGAWIMLLSHRPSQA